MTNTFSSFEHTFSLTHTLTFTHTHVHTHTPCVCHALDSDAQRCCIWPKWDSDVLNESDKQPAASQPLHQAALHQISGNACRSELLLQIKAVIFIKIFHPQDPNKNLVSYCGLHIVSLCSYRSCQNNPGTQESKEHLNLSQQSRTNNWFSSKLM